mgnify:CR=1 FL=1
MPRRRIVSVGDLHHPWSDRIAVKRAIKEIHEFQPEAVVQIGDLYDLYSFNRFGRSQRVMDVREEMSLARQLAQKFWDDVKAAAPSAKRYQLAGNHDIRPIRRIMDKAPEYEFIILEKFEDFMTFKGVTTILDPREPLTIDDVKFLHGFICRPGAHMMQSHENLVTGHSHRGSTTFHPWGGDDRWELNCGYLGDPLAEPLNYRPRRDFHSWTKGLGFIDAKGPRFVAFG